MLVVPIRAVGGVILLHHKKPINESFALIATASCLEPPLGRKISNIQRIGMFQLIRICSCGVIAVALLLLTAAGYLGDSYAHAQSPSSRPAISGGVTEWTDRDGVKMEEEEFIDIPDMFRTEAPFV